MTLTPTPAPRRFANPRVIHRAIHRAWPSALRAALLAAVVGWGAVPPAQAQGTAAPNLRRDVAQVLQAAQEAVGQTRGADALSLLAPLHQKADLTDDERLYLDRTSAAAALQIKDFALALPALESAVRNKALPAQERQALLESLVNTSISAKDFPRVEAWSRQCLQAGCSAPKYNLLLVQSLHVQGKHADVVAQMKQAQAQTPARTVSEAEWRVLAASQLELKGKPGYFDTLMQLVEHHPSKDYWADLLPRVTLQPHFNPRLELDVYRLLRETRNLEEPTDFTELANLAVKAGLPAEAVSALEQGLSQKVLKDGAVATLLQQHRKRALEDEQALPQLVKAASRPADWAQLGDLHLSAGRWNEAAEAYAKALQAGGTGLKHPEEVRLHYGVSLLKAGHTEAGRQALAKTGGDAQLIATLWQLWSR